MLLITLKDKTKWAIDLAGAQYGHQENLMPWGKYKEEKVGSIMNASHFGSSIRGWFSDYGPTAQEKVVKLNVKDPASIARAITCHSIRLLRLCFSVRKTH